MGIVRLADPATRRSRIRVPRIRLPRPTLVVMPSRLLLVTALAVGGAEAPDTSVRGLLLAGGLIVSYLAGHRDGRRDHALSLLGGRGTPTEPTGDS